MRSEKRAGDEAQSPDGIFTLYTINIKGINCCFLTGVLCALNTGVALTNAPLFPNYRGIRAQLFAAVPSY